MEDISIIDNAYLAQLLTTNNDLLLHIYILLLFALGCIVAAFVCVLLYKFLRTMF